MPRLARKDPDDAPPIVIDWRGWIAVGWVLFWGVAYGLTTIHARAPGLLDRMRRLLP